MNMEITKYLTIKNFDVFVFIKVPVIEIQSEEIPYHHMFFFIEVATHEHVTGTLQVTSAPALYAFVQPLQRT